MGKFSVKLDFLVMALELHFLKEISDFKSSRLVNEPNCLSRLLQSILPRNDGQFFEGDGQVFAAWPQKPDPLPQAKSSLREFHIF